MNRLNKFLQLSASERWCFLEAIGWLGLTRLVLLLFPLRWITGALGCRKVKSPKSADLPDNGLLWQIRREVRRAARHTPWKSQCLTQAIAAKMMLQRRGMASTLYLGVAKKKEHNLRAHAWLRCGELILTGHQGMQQFTIIATFGDEDRKM